MQKTAPTPEEINAMIDRGEDVSEHFGPGQMKPGRKAPEGPVRVNVDFAPELLSELDDMATQMNISRQAVIKMFVRDALDRHYMAKKARTA